MEAFDEDKMMVELDKLKTKMDTELKKIERKEKEREQEEQRIFDCIKDAMKEHKFSYLYNSDELKKLEIPFEIDNKPFRMEITIHHKEVKLRSVFPFRVQCNALALVAFFIVKFNSQNTTDFYLNLDIETGEIAMEYTYTFQNADFDEIDDFLLHVISLSLEPLKVYTKLHHLSVGKLMAEDDKEYYQVILRKSLEIVNGKEEEEDKIIYGTKDLQDTGDYKKVVLDKMREERLKTSIENYFKEDEEEWKPAGFFDLPDPPLCDEDEGEPEIFMPFEEMDTFSED